MATEVSINDLNTWLGNQPENTADTPYEITVTDLTTSNYGNIKTALQTNYTKYVDLSTTQLPNGILNLLEKFLNCSSLVYAPQIPNSVGYMQSAFKGCIALKKAPRLPDVIYNLIGTFYGCTSMTDAPIVPDTVAKDMGDTFYNCTSMTHKPILYSYTGSPFGGVTTKNWKGTRSQVEAFNPTCLDNCEIQIYNDDRITLEDTFHNVDISTLSTYLAGLDRNTYSTAYKVYIRGLTSSNAYDIRIALIANIDKAVDLGYTTIPQGTNCNYLFDHCYTLVKSAVLPTDATSLVATFRKCIHLKEVPLLPSGITSASYCFENCSEIVSTGNLEINTLENCTSMFNGCTKLTTVLNLPPRLYYMNLMFGQCSSIVSLGSVTIPSSVRIMETAFLGCTSLTEAPNIPMGVTNIENAFIDCSGLTSVPVVPSSVTNGKQAFSGCTSLRKIDEFNIPLATLKNNSNFQDMFKDCTSLESIGFKVDTDKWHAWRLKFDSNSVEGKIFGFENGQLVSTAIQNTQISKNNIKLPVLTDELWFPDSLMTDSEVEDVITDVLNNRYTYWKKPAINPTRKSLVMIADDPDNVVSNFLGNGEGIDVEVINNSKSITLNNDKRLIADGSGITVTLNYNSKVGAVTEIYAMQACTVTYYTAQGTTASLSMASGSKAVFIYYSGWKLHSNYGTTNSVTVDNMQSVSSNAVAQMLTTSSTENQIGYYGDTSQKLYSRVISFPADSFTYGQQIEVQLSSEFSNFIIVKLEAFLTKNNFTINCPLGEWLSVYMEARTKFNVKQNFTSNPSSMMLVIWFYYVKA